MAVPTGKKQVNFSATTELWEAFKTKAREQGLDGSALLNQLMQDYLGGDIGVTLPTPPESRELVALADKILARFDAWEEKIDKAGSNLPDLVAIRDRTVRDWESNPEKPNRIRVTQFWEVIDFFIEHLETAISAGGGGHIQRLKAEAERLAKEVERVKALYEAEQQNSAGITRRYKATKRRLKELGEDTW